MNKILVVDDQKSVCYSFQRVLGNEGYKVLIALNGEEAVAISKTEKPDLVIMDVKMPGQDGLTVLEQLKKFCPEIVVIMMTAYSTTEQAINAIKLGAYDYLIKPFDNDELIAKVKEAFSLKEGMASIVAFPQFELEYTAEKIVGQSPKMLAIYKQIGKIAPTDTTVLLLGESGTGKELIAKAIYQHSKRISKPFMTINCAAIPDPLLENELFGHEKGAFTGAYFRQIGRFEQCHGGTIFLDEIADMSFKLQAKLLRVLQDGFFERLGGANTVKTDVRIIAATNKDLSKMVEKGEFREDLYYRLNVVSITVPPLRERKEDIKDLTAYFIKKYNKILEKNIKGVTNETLKKLEKYHWPGNVRELENVIQRAMVFADSDFLQIEKVEGLPRESLVSLEWAIESLVDLSFNDGYEGIFPEIIETVEKRLIKKALEITRGNQVHAAKILGISRNTLRKKIGLEN